MIKSAFLRNATFLLASLFAFSMLASCGDGSKYCGEGTEYNKDDKKCEVKAKSTS